MTGDRDALARAARRELLRWCSGSEMRAALAAALPHLVTERDAEIAQLKEDCGYDLEKITELDTENARLRGALEEILERTPPAEYEYIAPAAPEAASREGQP